MNEIKSEMGIENLTYLNHASIGPLPKSTRNIVNNITNLQCSNGSGFFNDDKVDEYWKDIFSSYSKLIGGKSEGITMTYNTASGLHVVADMLYEEYRSGQNIVLSALEFTTNSYVWQQVARRYNLDIRVIPFINNTFPEDEIEKLVDDDTILTAISFVQFSNGYRADLKFISDLVHNHGGYLAVDGIQGLGIVPMNVEEYGVDFLATGGYKWLLGPINTGFLYTDPNMIQNFDSILVGWFGTPEYHQMTHHEYIPWEDGRKYQQSFNPMHLALLNSVNLLLKWGIDDNFRHVIQLQDYLVDKISEFDEFEIDTNLDMKYRSGTIRLKTKYDAVKLANYLKSNNIIIAPREGGIRISPHRHNTKEDIDILIDQLKEWSKNSSNS